MKPINSGIINSKKYVSDEDKKLLRAAGVKKIHKGVYTLFRNYGTVNLDCSTIHSAKFSLD